MARQLVSRVIVSHLLRPPLCWSAQATSYQPPKPSSFGADAIAAQKAYEATIIAKQRAAELEAVTTTVWLCHSIFVTIISIKTCHTAELDSTDAKINASIMMVAPRCGNFSYASTFSLLISKTKILVEPHHVHPARPGDSHLC